MSRPSEKREMVSGGRGHLQGGKVSGEKESAQREPCRLDRLLSREGLGSRSQIRKAVRGGKALVNGEVERDPGRQIFPGDQVIFEGNSIRQDRYVYYMLNKPAGVITATEDRHARTVLDLLREKEETSAAAENGLLREGQRPSGSSAPQTGSAGSAEAEAEAGRRTLRKELFPVGRLDRDTEGLLLITDDGQLAHRLLSPSRHVDKTYFAVVTGKVTEEEIRLFAEGLRVDDELTAMPAALRLAGEEEGGKHCPLPLLSAGNPAENGEDRDQSPLSPSRPVPGERSRVFVTIREGKFHQIKRMFAAVGKEVLYLKRISMGSLQLDDTLKPGQFRELTEEEREALRAQ